jgi:manganese oxidase
VLERSFRVLPLLPVLLLLGATSDPPRVQPNDNRTPAGRLENGVLTLSLVPVQARWYPEAESGPYADVMALAEEGKAPQIPAPLIRVPQGTTIQATIRNTFPDSTLWIYNLSTKPSAQLDSVGIPPGEARTLRFLAGDPGTYMYAAYLGIRDPAVAEEEQAAGAFIVDPPGPRAEERVFVINIWGQPEDSTHYLNAVAINGKSWPYTEAIGATTGDTLRWRVINASVRVHPMHLHGFYFRVDSRGNFLRDTVFEPARQRLAVTEDMSAFSTMAMTWAPERPGNWLFHCHLSFHVLDEARLTAKGAKHDQHATDPRRHMAGLVMGIAVRPGANWVEEKRENVRRMNLYVNEGARRGRAERGLRFIAQRDDRTPASDSVESVSSTIYVVRGEPTDITVHNRLREPTAVHWHGIELESWSDGVAGWSGREKEVAPAIMPGEEFVARLTLPRAGTFIYHTHLNDIEQVTSGLYGAIVVLEPGQKPDPKRDHVFVAGWDGPGTRFNAPFVVNGDTMAEPIIFAPNEPHRFRFVNIGPAVRVLWEVTRDTTLMTWKPLAKDGADLPPHAAVVGPARRRIHVGETFDVEFVAPEIGDYLLVARPPDPKLKPYWRQRIIVR